MNTLRNEQIAVGVALGLVVVTVTGFGLKLVSAVQPTVTPSVSHQAGHVPQLNRPQIAPAALWPAPDSQARGADWVYEVFTPPEIYYDTAAERLRVTPVLRMIAPHGRTPELPGFGLELREVHHAKFPLQLVGYVGEPGHFLGTFANLTTFETLLLGTADRVESLGLTIEKLEVKKVAVKLPESMTVNAYRASAVVRDDRTREVTTLQQGETQYREALMATVVFPDGKTSTREVGEGATLIRGEEQFNIVKIRLAPPSVDVIKEHPGRDAPEKQTLSPSPVQTMP